MLQSANEEIERAVQDPGKDKGNFADLISEVERLCWLILPKSDLVTYYVHGIKPALLDHITNHVHLMPRIERMVM